jgi:hypothetical protein
MTSHAARTTMFDTLRLPDGGAVSTGRDPGWDDARAAWNLAVDQRPVAVIRPHSAHDVVAAVEAAARAGLRVAGQSTGHNAVALGPLADTVLVRTDRMRAVTIDPEHRIARVGAGTIWQDVATAAAGHGLAALAGSAPDVGVAGYTLGGGLSWLGRSYGLAANSVTAVELVTADGILRRVDAEHEPDLFWALRGGGGGFGVVTSLEFRLYPVREVLAGVLWWPVERSTQVLHAWRDLVATGLPDELTTVGRLLNLPDIPDIPEPVRGRSWVVVEVIHLGDAGELNRLLTPLRALGPVVDTIAPTPMDQLSHLHMDPEQPVPFAGDGMLLADLPAEALDELVRLTAISDSPLLSLEVRQLGGALGREAPGAGVLPRVDAAFGLYGVGMTPVPPAVEAVRAHMTTLVKGLHAWEADAAYLNFADTHRDAEILWPGVVQRLREVKARFDPGNMIRANHGVDPVG